MINRRFQFGNRSFSPTGRPKKLGRVKTSLGKIDEYGPARTITLLVGQEKGQQPQNKSDRCARQPTRFSANEIDKSFFKLRGAQVGKKFVGATRQSGKGWYEGEPEQSLAYQISYIPPEGGGPPNEASFEDFSNNMNRLAEGLAEEFCQDSVLIIRDDGDKRSVAAASWSEEE